MPISSIPPEPDPLDELTEDARGTWEGVTDAHPNLSADALSRLWHVCKLESLADRLDEVAAAANFMSKGSQGQDVLHPGVAEARQSRVSASSILARLIPPPASARMTNSERGRAAASARWSGHAGRQTGRSRADV